jgi:phosphoribosyl-ATP pyrophosphohydrolase
MARDTGAPKRAKKKKAKPAKLEAEMLVKLPKKKAAAKPVKRKRKAALPLPGGLPEPPPGTKPSGAARRAESSALQPFEPSGEAVASVLDALWETIEQRRLAGDVVHSHSARLLARGTAKVAQKLGEEAVECVIEATIGNRQAVILESADLLYHLLVVWVDAGIRPEEVWAELARRQGISGIAEKASRPKGLVRASGTTKLP